MNVPQSISFGAGRKNNFLPLVEDTSLSFACLFTSIFVFIVYSRFVELLAAVLRANVPLVFVVGGLAFASVAARGGMFSGLGSIQGKMLVGFTVWMILAAAFGVWKSGSLDLITQIWLKSAIIFFMVVGSVKSKKDLRWVVGALFWGVSFVVLQSYVFGTDADRGAISFMDSKSITLANANGLALSLIVGLPFVLFYVLSSKNMIVRAACLLVLLAGCFSLLKTGSRGGLLALATMVLLMFFRASIVQKFMMILSVSLFLAVGITMLPSSATERFVSLLGRVESADAKSAEESRVMRVKLFWDSVRLTAIHPLFGVGPGNFIIETAKEASDEGRRGAWAESHNCYTKVSSETGIPGLLMFGTIMFASIWRIRKLYRRAREQGNQYWTELSFCSYISFAAYALFSTFDNGAYQFMLPLLAGVVVSIVPLANRDLAQRGGGLPGNRIKSSNRFASPVVSGQRPRAFTPVMKLSSFNKVQ